MSIDIILVHSGDRFPKHINDCISLIKLYNFNIHLILENKFHHLIKCPNINLISLESVEDYRYKKYTLQNYDNNFLQGFFNKTSSRFILIDNYVKKYNIQSFFHIENDIALFSNLENVKFYLENSVYHTAIIMDHPLRCVPSLIWYRNDTASNSMSNFIFNNNTLDDMKNLAIYFHKNRNTIINLPIVPFDVFESNYNINFGNMFNELNSIFDGAAIGQYLYGIDSFEKYPINSKGFINETCIFNPSKFTINFINKKPFIKQDDINISINNLHIHSKKIFELL